jgi:phage-related baseplate assembly protein
MEGFLHTPAMIYKFRSKAAGDTVMLGPQGDQFLRAIGRKPSAQGIIEVAAMPAALTVLQQAIEQDDAARARQPADEALLEAAGQDPIALRRRLWPMVEMIRRAQAADEPVVWGV